MRRCRSPIAIDFGEHRVKVLQLQRVGDRLVVCAAATAAVETAADGGATGGQRTARLAAAARRALRAAPFRGSAARVALNLDVVATRHLRIPHDQLEHAAERIVAKVEEPPAPPTAVAICPIAVSDLYEQGERKREFLCCLAPQPAVDELVALCEQVGLRPEALDLAPLAQARALLRAHATDSFVHVDIGAAATRIAVLRAGEPVLLRSIPIGGERLRAVLESHLRLDVAAVDALAAARPQAAALLVSRLVDALAETLETVVRRVADGIRYCGTLFHGRAVSALRVTGQLASLPGLVPYLEQRIGVPAQTVDPFTGIDAQAVPVPRRRCHTTTLGLALAGLPA